MKLDRVTWKEVADESAGDIREKVEVVLQALPGSEAGCEFLEKYEVSPGVMNPDYVVRCRDLKNLLKGLHREERGELADLIRLIRENVVAICQIRKWLRACSEEKDEGKEGEKEFSKYEGVYKRLKRAKFLPDKKFLTNWFFECSSYDERRVVMAEAVEHKVPLGVECFKTLVYDCSSDEIAEELKMFMRELEFFPSDEFFLFCLRNSRDEPDRVSAVVTAYKKIMKKSESKFFEFTISKCSSAIDIQIEIDWVFSIMRMVGFKPNSDFFVHCMKMSDGAMKRRVILHSIYLRVIGRKPVSAFFEEWNNRAVTSHERRLVDAYASARV